MSPANLETDRRDVRLNEARLLQRFERRFRLPEPQIRAADDIKGGCGVARQFQNLLSRSNCVLALTRKKQRVRKIQTRIGLRRLDLHRLIEGGDRLLCIAVFEGVSPRDQLGREVTRGRSGSSRLPSAGRELKEHGRHQRDPQNMIGPAGIDRASGSHRRSLKRAESTIGNFVVGFALRPPIGVIER